MNRRATAVAVAALVAGLAASGLIVEGQAHARPPAGPDIPRPYAGLKNPLPRTRATLDRGAEIYAAYCASCHGPTGLGEGEAAGGLRPPPANLDRLATLPRGQWDAYMNWTVAEGGTSVGSAMPAFKGKLSQEERWAVIAYIRARLPAPSG